MINVRKMWSTCWVKIEGRRWKLSLILCKKKKLIYGLRSITGTKNPPQGRPLDRQKLAEESFQSLNLLVVKRPHAHGNADIGHSRCRLQDSQPLSLGPMCISILLISPTDVSLQTIQTRFRFVFYILSSHSLSALATARPNGTFLLRAPDLGQVHFIPVGRGGRLA